MQAMIPDDDDPSGFEEAQSPFAGTAADVAAIYAAFGHRCAFTGRSLRAEAGADPLGSLLRLAAEAPVAPGNVLPAGMDAIHAYERGHLAIGARNEFLVALDRIDPEFLERLNAIGRLSLPADPQFAPNAALLKIHREEFAEGFIE
jgi:hypothetical protein